MTGCKVFIAFICLLLLIIGIRQNVGAQQQLPFGAKARFGINKGAISDTAFAPDRRNLASWSADGTILLWDWNKIRPDR